MLTQKTLDRLHQMRLWGMAEAFAAQLQKPDYQRLSFEERFGLLVDQEWASRQNRRLARLLSQVRLRLPACLEDVDYRHPRGLDRSLLRSLSTGDWLRARQNVLITGPTGVGKTFIACALANAACRQGFTARYYRVPPLLAELGIARGDGSYPRLLNQLARIDLLVLDDWGLAPFTDTQGRDLLEVLDDRAQARSTIVASQLPPDHWHGLMPDPTVADAILDRLVHNAHNIALKGESVRRVANQLQQSDRGG
ncbi:MAG: IS21-like element helper ATPase IstB [Armatimonadota bacterium]|nr:IS21-like element helper ATPase IstB [Armatimonadota bacterium]